MTTFLINNLHYYFSTSNDDQDESRNVYSIILLLEKAEKYVMCF